MIVVKTEKSMGIIKKLSPDLSRYEDIGHSKKKHLPKESPH